MTISETGKSLFIKEKLARYHLFWKWQTRKPKGDKRLRWKRLRVRMVGWSRSQNVDLGSTRRPVSLRLSRALRLPIWCSHSLESLSHSATLPLKLLQIASWGWTSQQMTTHPLVEAHRQVRINELNQQHNELLRQLHDEKEREKVLKQMRRGKETQPRWWETSVDNLNHQELLQMDATIDNLHKSFLAKLNEKTTAASSSMAPPMYFYHK